MSKTALLPTFEIDKEGLRKVLARKGMSWLLPELLQNAWDESATEVAVEIGWLVAPTPGDKGRVSISVTDNDPDGFKDISHAYTLFAESEKKDKSEKRGRFNVGEKLVVAACERAVISTTTGLVIFADAGREMLPSKRNEGSEFYGEVQMTQAEFDDALATVRIMFPPDGITTTINGEPLAQRPVVREFKETLRTPVGSELKIRDRVATIRLYDPLPDETPHLYEMGIPVVPLIEGGDRWHVDIGQKVPLNIDRDNVTPAYLRTIRRIVLDNAHDLLDQADAATDWTTDAAQDGQIGAASLGALLNLRFGEKRVAYDPSDPEANKIAVSDGYTVIHGGHLPKGAWANVKLHGLVLPAGQVTPSPKPYEPGQENTRKTEPQAKWTDGMRRVEALTREIATRLLGVNVTVEIVNDPDCTNFRATYGGSGLSGLLEFNLRVLGRKWFDEIGEDHVGLIIHELAHHNVSDHLSRDYYRELTDLGARLALVVAVDPEWFVALALPETAAA